MSYMQQSIVSECVFANIVLAFGRENREFPFTISFLRSAIVLNNLFFSLMLSAIFSDLVDAKLVFREEIFLNRRRLRTFP